MATSISWVARRFRWETGHSPTTDTCSPARRWRVYAADARGPRPAGRRGTAGVPTFGSLAHLHPHLHGRLTDGALRRDGTVVPLPPPDPAVREEAWRRAVRAAFVRPGGREEDAADGMRAWPHSGFGAYLGPRIEEREGVLRVARYSALSPGGRVAAARRPRARRGRAGG